MDEKDYARHAQRKAANARQAAIPLIHDAHPLRPVWRKVANELIVAGIPEGDAEDIAEGALQSVAQYREEWSMRRAAADAVMDRIEASLLDALSLVIHDNSGSLANAIRVADAAARMVRELDVARTCLRALVYLTQIVDECARVAVQVDAAPCEHYDLSAFLATTDPDTREACTVLRARGDEVYVGGGAAPLVRIVRY